MRDATPTLGFLLACCGGLGVSWVCAGAPAAEPTGAAYVGPAVGFVEDRSRARMRPACTLRLPEDKVTAQRYFEYVNNDAYRTVPWGDRRRFTDPEYLTSAIQRVPQAGPSYAVPALVMFERTRDPRYAKIVKGAIRAYRDWAKAAFAKGLSGAANLLHQPAVAAFEVKRLRRTKAMTPQDEAVVRDLFLMLAEKVFAWGGKVSYCRGSHHRAMNEGAVRRIAAKWYPDAPQAARWKQYADQQWQDWWRHRDLAINDCGYFWSSLTQAVLAAEVLICNTAVANLIREGKTHQVYSIMETNTREGMITMDRCVKDLYMEGTISYEEAVSHVRNPKTIMDVKS